MDIKKLKRDAAYIRSQLQESGNQLIALKETKIYFPARFAERDLASIGQDIYVIGLFAVVIDDKFSSMNVTAMVPLTPTTYTTIEIDDVEYYEFIFEPGSVVVSNTDLVIRDTLVYYIVAEIISKGNIPWYLGYHELAAMFDSSEKHAGTRVLSQRKAIELWVSILARNPDKLIQYYAETIQSQNDIVTRPPVIVGMRNVSLIASGTLNRVVGSYMTDGIVSSLLNTSEEVGLLEQILRQ